MIDWTIVRNGVEGKYIIICGQSMMYQKALACIRSR